MMQLLVVLTVTVVLLFCPTFAAPSDYHHMAFVGLRHHEDPPTYTARNEEPALSRRDDELPLPPEDTVPEEEQQSGDEGPRSLSTTSGSSARQAPYSYYYIGRKLWYVPLYFSLYFIIYVGALIIRAIARHKVTFPERLPNARDLGFEHTEGARLDRASIHVNSILDDMLLKYM